MLSKTVLNKIEKAAKAGKDVWIKFDSTNASLIPSKLPKNEDKVRFLATIQGIGSTKYEKLSGIKFDLESMRVIDKLYHTYKNIDISGCVTLDLIVTIEDAYDCGVIFEPRR